MATNIEEWSFAGDLQHAHLNILAGQPYLKKRKKKTNFNWPVKLLC